VNAQRICTHACMAKGKEVTRSVEQKILSSHPHSIRVCGVPARICHTP
jgi:hypothetical protein